MTRKSNKGFTLIELMVVIVIIGVLASLAIPRFTSASNKAKMAEAPRVIASYESGYLAAEAEHGNVTDFNKMMFDIPKSKWFDYDTKSKDAEGMREFTAKARSKIGAFAENETLGTVEMGNGSFARCIGKIGNKDAVEELIPNFQFDPAQDCGQLAGAKCPSGESWVEGQDGNPGKCE